MTRNMTVGTAALCALLLVAAQVSTSAQTKTPAKAPAKAAPAKAAPAKTAPAKAAPATAAPDPNSVTMTGCLETDGSKYRLADVQGNQTAKERSWKTGFITKKPKPIEVVGASSLNLKDHVGRKISVVGVKDGDTHLKARSIKQLGSCS